MRYQQPLVFGGSPRLSSPFGGPAFRYIRASDEVPALYATEGTDALVRVKLFVPWGSWSWYVIEFDPESLRCFGLVEGEAIELGNFCLRELSSVTKAGGALRLERDLHWKPRPLSVLQGELADKRGGAR